MLTKNAKKLLLYGLMNSGTTSTSNPSPTTTSFTLTNMNGANKTASLSYASVFSFINSLNHMAIGGRESTTFIRYGTGTTEVTDDDYTLEAINENARCVSAVTAIGGNNTKTYTATFSNTTDADIIVTEIGFFINCYYNNATDNDNFLLDHIVLDTPITIPAGESKAITYELGF